jgi:hypothetical protein
VASGPCSFALSPGKTSAGTIREIVSLRQGAAGSVKTERSRRVQFVALRPKVVPVWFFDPILRELTGSALCSNYNTLAVAAAHPGAEFQDEAAGWARRRGAPWLSSRRLQKDTPIGPGDAFWKDFRENTKPIFEEFKKAGLILDYETFTNPVTDHPGDWNVALSVSYPNYAALDQLAAKGASIAIKHYGSREAALAAGRKQDDIREVIASHLAREVTSK